MGCIFMSSRTNGKKSILFRLVVLLFALYLLFSLISLQIDLTNSKNELSALQGEIENRKLKNQDLLNLLENGSEKDFIERAARDRLGYVYADEEVYTDIVGG